MRVSSPGIGSPDESGSLSYEGRAVPVAASDAVTVDHREGALACVTPARPGQIIETQSARRRVPTEAAAPRPESELTPDVLVIGAGPAGLAAARDLAAAGLDVLLIDERKKLGGQFYKQPDPALPIDEARLDGQYTAGRRLIEAARRSGARLLLGASVWAAL